MVNCLFGARWFGSLRGPFSNNLHPKKLKTGHEKTDPRVSPHPWTIFFFDQVKARTYMGPGLRLWHSSPTHRRPPPQGTWMDRFLKNLEDGLAGLVSGGISHEKIRPFRREPPVLGWWWWCFQAWNNRRVCRESWIQLSTDKFQKVGPYYLEDHPSLVVRITPLHNDSPWSSAIWKGSHNSN